jgi:hypothetical protein
VYKCLIYFGFNSSVIEDLMRCIRLKVGHHFKGAYCLPLQYWNGSQYEAEPVSCLAYCSTHRGKHHVMPKHRLTFDRSHNIISQKTKLVITAVVRTACPTLGSSLVTEKWFILITGYRGEQTVAEVQQWQTNVRAAFVVHHTGPTGTNEQDCWVQGISIGASGKFPMAF